MQSVNTHAISLITEQICFGSELTQEEDGKYNRKAGLGALNANLDEIKTSPKEVRVYLFQFASHIMCPYM